MTVVDLVIAGLLLYAAYVGTKRGAILIALELLSFVVATVIGFIAYEPMGVWVKVLSGLSISLSNVVAFALVWMLVEILAALLVRLAIWPHLPRHLLGSLLNQILGAVLNLGKTLVMVALALIVFAGLPLSAGTKQYVTTAFLARTLLNSTSHAQAWLASGLGRDINQSLNFFTVTAEPESEQRVELGYTTQGSIDAADEAAMLALLNHERTNRGLKPLSLNAQARAVARAYSADMFARGYFSHVNPEGKTPFDRMQAGGVQFNTAGENLALAPTLQLAHQGLMNSPGHRANILNPEYRTVGIGIIDGGPYGLMITQDFTD